MIVSGLLLGLAIGVVMGLTGAGGGILAIPALVLGMGMDMMAVKPVALLAATAGAALGAADGLRRGLVRYKAALFMVLLGAITSPLGQWVAHQMAPGLLALLFSAVLLYVAVRGWRQSLQQQAPQAALRTPPCLLNPATGKFRWTPRCFFTLGGIGAVTGLMTGMLGIGGGFFIVPMLQHFTNLTYQSVVLTSLAVIALVSGSTVLQMLVHGTPIHPAGWWFVGATALGMLASRMVAHRVPRHWLQRAFSVLVLLAMVLLLLKTFAPDWLPVA